MTTVLLVDDDRRHTELLSEYLERFEMNVLSARHAEECFRMLGDVQPDLIILDVMMPGKNGFEICRDIRRTSQVPIIMLTARGDVTDRVVGLEIGADDYLAKPFEPRELVARIQNVLRRLEGKQPEAPPDLLRFENLEIDLQTRSVVVDGKPAELTTMEFEMLTFLARHPGHKLSRDEILGKLRGIDTEIFTRSVDIMISRLRQKLSDTEKPGRFIQTVWGHGYCFVGRPLAEEAGE
ncbi:MAG: response regulator transcription factor [Pseudomonadota bacterium]